MLFFVAIVLALVGLVTKVPLLIVIALAVLIMGLLMETEL